MQRIGIYSGTFDPIHEGHVRLCLDAIKQCGLDKVLLLVEPKPWRKQTVTTDHAHREAMARIAVASHPKVEVVSNVPERLSASNTLPALKEYYPDARYCLILGADEYATMPQWDDVTSLLKNMAIIVSLRENTPLSLVTEATSRLRTRTGIEPSTVSIRSSVPQAASSTIRKEIAADGYHDLLHPVVRLYIGQNGLYGFATQ